MMWRIAQEGEPLGHPDKGNVQHARRAEILFKSETPRLLRYFRRWRGGQDEAADLVQEVFVRAATSTGFQSTARPEAYLQRIARNLLFERARHDRRRAHISVPITEAHETSAPPEQEDRVATSQMERIYEKALSGLTVRTREIYLMHRVDEMSYKAIAEQLAISPSGVEKHMMKAIAHIDRVVLPWR